MFIKWLHRCLKSKSPSNGKKAACRSLRGFKTTFEVLEDRRLMAGDVYRDYLSALQEVVTATKSAVQKPELSSGFGKGNDAEALHWRPPVKSTIPVAPAWNQAIQARAKIVDAEKLLETAERTTDTQKAAAMAEKGKQLLQQAGKLANTAETSFEKLRTAASQRTVGVDALRSIVRAAPADNTLMGKYTAALNDAMHEFGITTNRERAAFLAQSAQESIGLNHMREDGGINFKTEQARLDALAKLYGPKGTYGFRPDVLTPRYDAKGAVSYSPSDPQYYGRGYLQLTGKDNYIAASKALFNDNRLEKDPDLVARDPVVAARAAGWYWTSHVRLGHTPNQLADKTPSIDNFKDITRAVNGGLTGLPTRELYYQRAIEELYFGVGRNERLVGVGDHVVTDDGNNATAHVAAKLQTAIDAANAYKEGQQAEIWVSHYLGKDKKGHELWSNPYAKKPDPHDHRILNAGDPASAVDAVIEGVLKDRKALGALDHMIRLTKNAEQAPWLALQFGTREDADNIRYLEQTGLTGQAATAWKRTKTARSLIVEAVALFDEARKAVNQQNDLVKEGNDLIRQAGQLVAVAEQIWWALYDTSMIA